MKLKWFFVCPALLAAVLFSLGCNHNSTRTDAQVAAEVQGTLAREAKLVSRDISVQADQGVVTLSGSVPSDEDRSVAAADAARVEGVKTVVNNLVVQPPQMAANTPEAMPLPPPEPPVAAKVPARRAKAPQEAVGGLPKARRGQAPEAANVQPAPSEPEITTPAPPPPPKKITIPAGTQITVRLNSGLDTERNQIGDQFHATLSSPIVVDDETAIPSGADLQGSIVDLKSAGRFSGSSELTLQLNSLSINGRSYNIQTNQWKRQGKGEGTNTAVKAGGGAALGAIIGGLAGGGKGAAIGSVAGAGAGTGVAAAKKGEQIKLAPEASLSFLIIDPLTVTQQMTNNRNAGRTPLN